MNERNYCLGVQGEYIYLMLKNGAGPYYFTYNEDFLKVLNEWKISSFRNDKRGRLRCYCWKGRYRNKIRFYLYDLACACYMGRVKSDSLVRDMRDYRDFKASNRLTIDHADDNPHNNTVLNLSLMPRSLNSSKNTIVSCFKPPYYLNSVFCDGEYRVQIVTETDSQFLSTLADMIGDTLTTRGINGSFTFDTTSNTKASMQFVCEDAESYVACLQSFLNTRYEWCNAIQTPREHSKENSLMKYWADNINCSLQAQKMLSLMERAQFQEYRKQG